MVKSTANSTADVWRVPMIFIGFVLILIGVFSFFITYKMKMKWRLAIALFIAIIIPALLLLYAVMIGDRPMPGSITVY